MQSAQARQRKRKRERKRLKREEKRRSLGSSLPLGLVPFPGPKMSDTLLDHARPLIDGLPDDAGLEVVDEEMPRRTPEGGPSASSVGLHALEILEAKGDRR